MIRQHQFSKVEMVAITTPEESEKEHERMIRCAEETLRHIKREQSVFKAILFV